MAGRNQAVLVLATFAAIVGLCSAASITVGGKTGWTVPPSTNFYTNWASKQSVKVGDDLVFIFQTGAHTVAEVTKAAYDSCSLSNPIIPAITTSPAKMTITSPGTKYYLCTIPGHCALGQKLAVVATGAASAPSTAPATSPTPSKAAPTAPKAAPTTPTSSPSTAPATSPSGSGVPTVPATSGPSADGAAPPPTNSFAAPAAGGASLMSLVAIAAAALFV